MLLSVLVGLLVGWLNALYAPKKGRDPVAWFILGILFSFLSSVTLLLLPPVRKKKAKPAPSPSYSGTTINVTPLDKGSTHEIRLEETEVWYYLDGSRQQKGPIGRLELERLYVEGIIGPKTYLWCEGMPEWKLLENLKYLYSNLK